MSVKRTLLTMLALAPLFGWCGGSRSDVARSVNDLSAALTNDAAIGIAFDITAQVLFPPQAYRTWFTVCDKTGVISLADKVKGERPVVRDGDVIRATGKIEPAGPTQPNPRKPHANCHAITVVSPGTLPPPVKVTAQQVISGGDHTQRLRIDGVIRDAVQDEIDPRYVFFAFNSAGETFFLPAFCTSNELDRAESLIGSHVSVTGISSSNSPTAPGSRKTGKSITTRLDLIHVLDAPSSDWFDVPELDEVRGLRPSQIAALGRHRLTGRVIAAWRGRNILVRTENGHITRINLLHDNLPCSGQWIVACGIPEFDLYNVNLSRARWRATTPRPTAPEDETTVSAAEILYDENGQLHIRSAFHGKCIRMTGVIRSIPADSSPQTHFLLDCNNVVIPVDFSSAVSVLNGLAIGCKVQVRGTCVMETENWRMGATFPQIKGILIVLRTAEDVLVLEQPPWWTPVRFAMVVGLLLAFLVAILIWNATLRVMVARKSHALLKEQAAKLSETLKIGERTRLAAELHDYLAQNLTVVAYQVSAAQDSLGDKDPETGGLLRAAVKMLQSCRTELRRCLWDLRNDVLDEPDFTTAIRRSVEPVAGDTVLFVRFEGARGRLSDSTAHAILSILRELASNATIHGQAKEIRIAGECHDGHIRLSIRDDGIGFDPDNRPGQDDGHFGLDGIRERLERLNGTMTIQSARNAGTHIRIELKT